MSNIFDKWNNAVDAKALANEVKDIEKNGGQERVELPLGEYEVKVEKLELKESKTHKPMISAWFKILKGEFKGQYLFMNQVVEQAFQIHIANEFLRSLDSGVDVEFDGNYEDYNNTILDVHEAIDGKVEYLIEYSEKKGYSVFKVLEVYDA